MKIAKLETAIVTADAQSRIKPVPAIFHRLTMNPILETCSILRDRGNWAKNAPYLHINTSKRVTNKGYETERFGHEKGAKCILLGAKMALNCRAFAVSPKLEITPTTTANLSTYCARKCYAIRR